MSDTRHRPASPSVRTTHARRDRARIGAQVLALALILTAPLLGGCAALVLGGAAAGAAAVHDRRTYGAILEDQEIEMNAMAAMSNNRELKERTRISVTSYNRKVLLVGQAESKVLAERAAELVARLPKVERVIDEVTVGPNISLWREGEDVLVTSRAKLSLIDVSLPGFDPTRVKVVTEDGVVYLMGLVTPEEGDAAAEAVRYVPGVNRVVKLFEYTQPET